MKSKIIVKIKKNKKKAVITFEDDTKLEVFPTVLVDFKLYETKIVSLEQIENIKTSSKEEELFDFALRKFKLQNFTTKKIRVLLNEKTNEKALVDKVINRLKTSGILNEEALLKECLEYADYKHYGYIRIIKKLNDLEMSDELINKVKISEIREKKHAEAFIDSLKKKYLNKNNFKRKETIYNCLLRQGFSRELSLELVSKIANSNNIHELNVLKLDYLKAYDRLSKKYNGLELSKRIENNLLNKGYKINDIKLVEENHK